MSAFVETLKVEIAGLEDQLARDPRYQQLQQLKRVLPFYENAPSTPPTRAESPSRVRSSGAPSASDEIKNAARQGLVGATRPVRTRDIVMRLTERGVKIGGRVPQNTLSALLSKSDAFLSHGRSGWALSVPNGHEAKTETAGDDSSPKSASPATFERRSDQPAEPPTRTWQGGGT